MAPNTPVHIGDAVTYQGRPHTISSVKLNTIAGPHVRMLCGPACGPTCDAGSLTSVQLLNN